MRMSRRSRFDQTLVVALALHAGAAIWAWHATQSAAVSAEAGDVVSSTETDVEIEPRPADPAATFVEPSAASREPAGPAGLEARAATRAHGDGSPSEGPPAPAASSEPGASGAWTFSPAASSTSGSGGPLSGDALGSAVHAGVGEIVAEDARKREAFARKHVIPAFTARDLELGLVPGGALVTLTRDLVRRSRTPVNGHALLQLDTDAAGIVRTVRILDASAGRAEWGEVGAQIAAAAGGKPLRVPDGASGLSVTLEVTSALKTASGGTPTDSSFAKALGAINDPLGTIANAHEAAQRVVAAHVVSVQAF
jgi:hypothetical protein